MWREKSHALLHVNMFPIEVKPFRILASMHFISVFPSTANETWLAKWVCDMAITNKWKQYYGSNKTIYSPVTYFFINLWFHTPKRSLEFIMSIALWNFNGMHSRTLHLILFWPPIVVSYSSKCTLYLGRGQIWTRSTAWHNGHNSTSIVC